MVTPAPAARTVMRTERPWPNFSAFESRLVTICSIAVESHQPCTVCGGPSIVTPSVPENVVSSRFTVVRIVAPTSRKRGRMVGRPERCSSVIVSIRALRRWTSERTTRRAGVSMSAGSRLA
jgi:hypothetical protein